MNDFCQHQQPNNGKQDATNKQSWGGAVSKNSAGLFAYAGKPKELLKCTDKNTKGPEVMLRATVCH